MSFDRVRWIELPKVADKRGNLSFIESARHIPFEIARTYWLYDVPGDEHRNGHAFKEQEEFIVALSGSYHMARSYYGLYVPRMMWRELDNFSTNSLALVLSSTLYDAGDYIEDFEEYRTLLKGRNDE